MFDILMVILSGILGGVLVAFLPRNSQRKRNGVALIACLIQLVFVWRAVCATLSGKSLTLSGSIGGVSWHLCPDPLGIYFAVITSFLWLLTTIYSYGYMAEDNRQKTYFVFFLLSSGITLGIAFAGDLLVLYIFYELLTFCTYPLVIHKRSEEAMRAGMKYIVYSLIGASAVLAAMVITWAMVGTLDFSTGALLQGIVPRPALYWLLLLFIVGFGVKAAVMPLHRWLPSAMVAPTPVSALLHAVAVVNAGAFGVLRVVYSVFGQDLLRSLGISEVLMGVAAFTIVVASVISLRQDVLKRRLAYSTISQLSYILLGAFTLHPLGLAGAVAHMLNHSIVKSALFFCAGIIEKQTGEVKVSKMKGLGKSLPWTFGAFGLASLGMIGMLPLNAFWSKYYLLQGSLASGWWPSLVVLVGVGFLNALCFLPIPIAAFTGEQHTTRGRNVTTLFMLVPTLGLVGLALILGIWPGLTWTLVDSVVDQFFLNLVVG